MDFIEILEIINKVYKLVKMVFLYIDVINSVLHSSIMVTDITEDVKVSVETAYRADYSDPAQSHFVLPIALQLKIKVIKQFN